MSRMDDARAKARAKAKQQAEENKYSGGSTYLKLPEGVKFYRLECEKGKTSTTCDLNFLPYRVTKNRTVPDTPKRDIELEKGELWWQRSVFIHRNVGPEKKQVCCPKTVGKPCPICEEKDALSVDYNENKKLIGQLKPQHKDLMLVENDEGKITVFEHSYANFRKILEKELREQNKDEYYDFFQLEEGYTITCRFQEEVFEKNKYFEADRIDFEKRDDYKTGILDETFDFDDCLVILPYDKINKIFLGLDDDDVKDEEPEKEKDEKLERESSKSQREEPEPKKDETPEPEPEPEKPAPRRTRRGGYEEKKEDDGPVCPFKGRFGHDCDKLPECPDCEKETWEACAEKQDELKAKK